MEPFCSQFSADELSVLVTTPNENPAMNWPEKFNSLAAGMPNYGAESYFQTKGAALIRSDIVVLVQNRASEQVIGLLAASWSRTNSPRFLYIKTLLIAEKWQRSQVIHLAWRGLFERIIKTGDPFPPVIVFKTVNPRSFAAMAAFRRVPGAVIYPFLNWTRVEDVMPTVRLIAAELAPDSTFEEHTGVLKGASEGVIDFYHDMPLSGTNWIDLHFKQHLSSSDRMLACLFTGGSAGASRILRAFGIRGNVSDSGKRPVIGFSSEDAAVGAHQDRL